MTGLLGDKKALGGEPALKKIKAYIVYYGRPDWYNATLIFENGWSAFGHLCSHPHFMPGDLWERREERQEVLKKMGYEVELHNEIIEDRLLPNNHQWLIDNNKNEQLWKPMAEEYERVSQELERAALPEEKV